MGKIGDKTRYGEQTPSINDYLIGTDGDVANKATHNYPIRDLVTLFLENSEIEGIVQDNRAVLKNLGQAQPSDSIASLVNNTPEFYIGEQEIFVFTFFRNLNVNPNVDQGSILSPNRDVNLITYKYLFTRGKGFYGTEIDNVTRTVSLDDFILIEEKSTRLPSRNGFPPIVHYLPNTTIKPLLQALNTGGTFIIDSNTPTYFNVNNINGYNSGNIYVFVGASGTYGLGATQFISSDLLTLEEAGLSSSPTSSIKIVESIPIFIPLNSSIPQIVNSLSPFYVSENELLIFNFRKAIQNTNYSSYIEKSSYFFKRGKGSYNAHIEHVPFTDNDFKLNYKEPNNHVSDLPNIRYYYFNTANTNIVDAVNSSKDPIVKSDATETLIESTDKLYKLIGANGNYGSGMLQITVSDLEEIDNVPCDCDTIKAETINEILTTEKTYLEKTSFDKMIKLQPIPTPDVLEDGMVWIEGKSLRYYIGGTIYTVITDEII